MVDKETNDWNVTINDVIKINIDKGDVLLVTLPPQSTMLPTSQLNAMGACVCKAVKAAFIDKDIEVLVLHYGTEVQLIKGSELEDK